MGTQKQQQQQDTLDKLVVFLAKRDGIDKLVKTFQYLSKLAHWHLEQRSPSSASRAKNWEVSSGLARKAFRTGRSLSGFNLLRRSPPPPSCTLRLLALLANGGEMVYFFFDHLLWLSRAGVLPPHLARRFGFVSAFGESLGYVFFVVADVLSIRHGLLAETRLRSDVEELVSKAGKGAAGEDPAQRIEEKRAKMRAIRMQRVMQVMAIAANLADLVIAIADVEPNPFCCHAVTLGISGLVSAWAGWYRNWPAS